MLTKPVLAAPVDRSLPGGARSGVGADQSYLWPHALPTEGADQSLIGWPHPAEGVDQSFYPFPFPAEGADQSLWLFAMPAEGADLSYMAFMWPTEGADA